MTPMPTLITWSGVPPPSASQSMRLLSPMTLMQLTARVALGSAGGRAATPSTVALVSDMVPMNSGRLPVP